MIRSSRLVVRDLPLAVLLTAAALVPDWHRHGTRLSDLVPERPFDLLGVLVVTIECLPLAVRRKWPALSLALVSCGFAFDQFLGFHTIGGTALAIALISAGAHQRSCRKAVMVAATVGYVVFAVVLNRIGPAGFTDFVLFYLVLAAMWGVGSWLRQHRVAEQERARAAERSRIARELHDVVTHHVTAMVVQAEAARYLTAAPERLDQTLSAVSDTGRQAISELRHLLDLLHPGHGGELRALITQTRRAGQPVELIEEGPPAPNPTVYRVAQEALTNALKYDHGAPTTVAVRYGESGVDVRISTDGSGSATAAPGGGGRGLTGLRERVGTLGGDFSAGPQPRGGFVVTARIPAGAAT
ncbi:histidine kinase [Actinoplanes sp. TRM 88003]|uniref:histidine kinase n=1 Tax=Paractinoplanes aksuensis TaxID=2939490 RepID=A0ABT1DSH0_9ACTN|nr:histidine kinase [Actinoplanes aksuensis]MCO8273783.1 histidine kinase [Actinoplanes aksuensis]